MCPRCAPWPFRLTSASCEALHRAQSHDVEASVEVENFSRQIARRLGTEESGDVTHILLLDVTVQGGHLLDQFEHGIDVTDAAGGERAQRACRDAVHTHVVWAEVPGKVANRGLKRGLGDAHEV